MEIDAEELQDDAIMDIPPAAASEKGQENLAHLLALQEELTHFVEHGVEPSEEWYALRYPFIELYNKLRWYDFADTFKDHDDYLYEYSLAIHMMLGDLITEYSTRPTFTFELYCSAINSIAEVWEYYSKKYMGDETDLDIVGLIESISFMKT